jgi:hypothetical protein
MKNLFFFLLLINLLTSCKDKIPPVTPKVVEQIQIDTIDLTNTTFDRRFGVWDMKFDSKDRLWIGTTNGLLMYDQQTKVWQTFDKSNFPPPNGFSIDYDVYHIEIDKNDNVYVQVGQVNNQLYVFNGTTWRVDSLPNYLRFFTLDNKNNTLWVGTDSGLLSIKNGVRKLYDKDNSILTTMPPPNQTFYYTLGMDTDSNGTLWFGHDGDLVKFDGTNWQRFKNADLPNKGWITRHVRIDNNGLIFIAGYDVCYTFNGKAVVQNLSDTLKVHGLTYVDEMYFNPTTNNVFFRTFFNVLYYNRDKQAFQVIDTDNSKLPQRNSMPCIAFDSKGNAWIAKSSFIGQLPKTIR